MSKVMTASAFLIALIGAGCAVLFWLIILLNGMSHGTDGDAPAASFAMFKWGALICGAVSCVVASKSFMATPKISWFQSKVIYVTMLIGGAAAGSIMLVLLSQ